MLGTLFLLGLGFCVGLVASRHDSLSEISQRGYDKVVELKDSVLNKKID